MKKNFYAAMLGAGLLLTGCQNQPSARHLWVADVREAIRTETPVSLKEDVASVSYVPLETTDSCLISNVSNLVMDDEFIFVENGKTQQIFQFTREGKYVRQLGRAGNGPGEYAPYAIESMTLDSSRREIYLNARQLPAWVYSYDGTFLRRDTLVSQAVGYRFFLDREHVVLGGAPVTPFAQSPWLVALANEKQEISAWKDPFSPSLGQEVRYMQEIQFMPYSASVVAYTPCNDTLFRVTSGGISPAVVLDRRNGKEYYEQIADINYMQTGGASLAGALDLYGFLETDRCFFFRIMRGEDGRFYILRLDKESRKLSSTPVNETFQEMSYGLGDGNIAGLDNDVDGGIPFWPCYVYGDQVRVQVVNTTLLEELREQGYLQHAPEALQTGPDQNPVVIIYTFR